MPAASRLPRRSPVVVEYVPLWRVYWGLSLSAVGLVGLVPLNLDWFEIVQWGLLVLLPVGVVLLLSGFQQMAWRLELVGNTLYYQKFHLYMDWKQRRTKEFTLNVSTISDWKVEPKALHLRYGANKVLVFKTLLPSKSRYRRLEAMGMRIFVQNNEEA